MAIRFTNILRDLIIESTRFQLLFDKYVKPSKETKKGAMPFHVLFQIIAADPTSRIPQGLEAVNAKPEDMEKVKIGKYTKWLLKHFTTPNIDLSSGITEPNGPAVKQAIKEYQALFLEDLYKITGDLLKYERFKDRIPQEYRDINKLTPETLYDQVKDFSLEKTKATKSEKKEAAATYQHPGADVVYRGTDWTIVKISDKTQLGKDAAIFYGGNYLEPQKGETRWCTSGPGLTFFEGYISRGPLYVIIPNSPRKFTGSMDVGEKSGLPALRYQFHFPDNQYMDPADRQIDMVKFLQENEPGLKEYFKPEIMKGLSQNDGEKVNVTYDGSSSNNNAASKFIALYGFDEFFETLPPNIKKLFFTYKGSGSINLPLPESIGKFKDLTTINISGGVTKIPNSICDLKNLKFLSLNNSPNLQPLPACIANLPKLSLISLIGSKTEGNIPDEIKQLAEKEGMFHIFV